MRDGPSYTGGPLLCDGSSKIIVPGASIRYTQFMRGTNLQNRSSMAPVFFAMVLSAMPVACARAQRLVTPEPPPPLVAVPVEQSPDNLVVNPSFEDDEREPWFCFAEANPEAWGDFTIADGVAHEGKRSARLVLDSEADTGKTRIYGVVQEIETENMPDHLSGWYRVEGWQRGAPRQYLQAVVIVWRPRQMPKGIPGGNYQIAYTLAGVKQPPLHMRNRAFIITGPPEPTEDEWVFFELNPREDFQRKWGIDPKDFKYLRVFFEVRYDGITEGGPPAKATVYYDDLYMGSQSRKPEETEKPEAPADG
jgi:hypothetical protein